MQTELANLIKGIDGINDAKVMINLPEQGIFVNDAATRSICFNCPQYTSLDINLRKIK